MGTRRKPIPLVPASRSRSSAAPENSRILQFGSAFLVYPDGEFPALQIVVATPEGKWPWDADAPEGFAEWQPVLTDSGRPETWTPGADGP